MQISKENLTIIIVTIKSDKIIDSCLRSIDPDVKKIIVENSNNKDFLNKLLKNYKNLECFHTGKNLGMGTGNNFGISKSNTRYVMILNPDTILRKNTLNEIFNISKNLDFAILSPISDNKDFPNFKIKKNYSTSSKDLIEVDSVDGYAMILDKTKFDYNFFDEKFFMYLENDDLCLRVKKKGEKIFIYKKSYITHLGAKAVDSKYTEELNFSRNWHWNWSRYYFKKKHHGIINALLFCVPMIIRSYIRCFFHLMLNDKYKYKIYYCRASGLMSSLLNKNSWYRPRLD